MRSLSSIVSATTSVFSSSARSSKVAVGSSTRAASSRTRSLLTGIPASIIGATLSALEAHVRDLARQVVRAELARHTPQWEWLTVDAAAELLGCTPKAIRGKLERGMLEAHRFDGRVYVSRRELDEAIRRAPGGGSSA